MPPVCRPTANATAELMRMRAVCTHLPLPARLPGAGVSARGPGLAPPVGHLHLHDAKGAGSPPTAPFPPARTANSACSNPTGTLRRADPPTLTAEAARRERSTSAPRSRRAKPAASRCTPARPCLLVRYPKRSQAHERERAESLSPVTLAVTPPKRINEPGPAAQAVDDRDGVLPPTRRKRPGTLKSRRSRRHRRCVEPTSSALHRATQEAELRAHRPALRRRAGSGCAACGAGPALARACRSSALPHPKALPRPAKAPAPRDRCSAQALRSSSPTCAGLALPGWPSSPGPPAR
jgi:hypothetical protein